MIKLIDNPPALPGPRRFTTESSEGYDEDQYKAGIAAAFARGAEARRVQMQGEIDELQRTLRMREDQITIEQGMKLELKAKLKALEETAVCAACKGTGIVQRISFVDSTKTIGRSCPVCWGSGKLGAKP